MVPERGRFRHWLCACARHHLDEVRSAAMAQKRGGGRVLSLDLTGEDEVLRREPIDPQATPEQAFAQRWVRAVIDCAFVRLGGEWEARGRGRVFAKARGCVDDGGEVAVGYAVCEAELGMSEGAFKVAVHRLRERLRELLQDEVRQTLDDPAGVQDEIGLLLGELAARKSVLGA